MWYSVQSKNIIKQMENVGKKIISPAIYFLKLKLKPILFSLTSLPYN